MVKTYLFWISSRLIVSCGAFRLPAQKWLGRTRIDASLEYKWWLTEDVQEEQGQIHDLKTSVSNCVSFYPIHFWAIRIECQTPSSSSFLMISNEHGPSNSMCIPEDSHPSFQSLKCLCWCVGGRVGERRRHSHFPAWESHLAEVRLGWAWDGLLASFFDRYCFHQYSSVHGPP